MGWDGSALLSSGAAAVKKYKVQSRHPSPFPSNGETEAHSGDVMYSHHQVSC